MKIHMGMEDFDALDERTKMEFVQWIGEEDLHDIFDFTLDGRRLTGLRFKRDENNQRYYDREKREVAWEEFEHEITVQPPTSWFTFMAGRRDNPSSE